MSGGIPLRSITAVAAISLLALASFGTVLVFEIPVTADEALHHAEDVSDPGDVYLWKCPTSDGSSYTNERLELDIPTHDRNTLVTDKSMRGRKVEKQVTGRFDDTSISHLGYYRPGSNAANYYKERKARGTLPVPVKLLKKKADATKGTVSGPIGATATKSPNRRIVRGRK